MFLTKRPVLSNYFTEKTFYVMTFRTDYVVIVGVLILQYTSLDLSTLNIKKI